MSTRNAALLVGAIALYCPAASAVIHVGNPQGPPKAEFKVSPPEGTVTSGSVYVDHVRVHDCDGTYTDYDVDAVISPWVWFSVDIDGGDLCELSVAWGSDMVIDGTDDSGGVYTLRYTGIADMALITGHEEVQPLEPVSVESGSVPPLLVLHTRIVD